MIPSEIREQVRLRAEFRCEYCGVAESDTAGELTLDHFRPRSKNGTDELDNLLYCCHRCNEYKADYWPDSTDRPQLWNPRTDRFDAHFVLTDDGYVHSGTATGEFTIRRLRLNRPPLVAYRHRQRIRFEERRLSERYKELLALFELTQKRQKELLDEQRELLTELKSILVALTQGRE